MEEQMARQILSLASILIALLGIVSADTKAVSSTTFTAAPTVDDAFGSVVAASASHGGTHEGPVGSAATAKPPSSNGATSIGVSEAVAGAAAIASSFVF